MAIGGVELRPVIEEEFPAFAHAIARQFGEDLRDAWVPRWRRLSELDRSLAAFVAGDIVATALVNSDRMALPGGGDVACAGVTGVGVRTTHRRRGLMTAMMRRLVDQAVERREPVAALYASEAPIYGRYGFGPAAPSVRFDVDISRGGVAGQPELDRALDLVDAATAQATFPSLYEAARSQHPGLLHRSGARWDVLYGTDDEEDREGFSARYYALLPQRGYAVYRIKAGWADDLPDGTVRVIELIALDAGANAALWRLLTSIDLVVRLEAQLRPPDDPLPHLLADRLAARSRTTDPLYVRLLDVPAALAARRYAVDGSLVLEVTDDFCPHNAGGWRLEGGPDCARCRPTTEPPDAVLDAADLAALFLGGQRWATLAAAGRVHAQDPAVLRRADAMFGWQRLPWNAQIF